ncbi:MAG: VWA domain-containing protein [Candidatus Solibacter sp.]
MMKLPLVVCLAAFLLPLAGPSQIRVEVSLVNVGFSVRDEKGNLVNDLKQEDFEVFEDGAAQKIAFFARSTDVPLTLGLMMDVSGSQQSFLRPHHDALQSFLKAVLRPQDRAFLVCFGNSLRLMSDYTNSAKELVEGLRIAEKGRRLEDFPIIGPREHRILGTAFYDAIYYGSTQMMKNEERGRRALIVFSDGEDNSSAHHMLETIEAAQSNNVLLFTVRYTENPADRLNARNKYGIGVMERMARETGGLDFDGQGSGLGKSFHDIDEQLRSSYELAYHTTNATDDKTFHKITIRPKRPGLTVRAKAGYFAR